MPGHNECALSIFFVEYQVLRQNEMEELKSGLHKTVKDRTGKE